MNIGVAIAVDDGLIAPALLDCSNRSVDDLATGLADLVARTRAGRLRAAELGDATFTLSNLGMFDVTAFTAIVTPPQVAILATARTEPRAVVRDGAVTVRQLMTATLSSDHRVVDGVGAARFLETFKGLVQAPDAWAVAGAAVGAALTAMTLLAGAAVVDITPPLPVDVLGYVRRPVAPRGSGSPCEATACVLRDDATGTTVAIIAADVVGLTTPMADRIRERVARCDRVRARRRAAELEPLPRGAVAGRDDQARRRDGRLDRARASLLGVDPGPVRVGRGPGRSRRCGRRGSRAASARVHGLAVNRRERTADGRTILGWNRDGFIDDSVVAIRIDEAGGEPAFPAPIATLVGFGCHPVVVGPEVPDVGPDFVGPLRAHLGDVLRPGAVTVFLQGAAGNVLPLEAFLDEHGAGGRVRGAAGARGGTRRRRRRPAPDDVEQLDWGSVTPISLYRRRLVADPPAQALRAALAGSSTCRSWSCRRSTTWNGSWPNAAATSSAARRRARRA